MRNCEFSGVGICVDARRFPLAANGDAKRRSKQKRAPIQTVIRRECVLVRESEGTALNRCCCGRLCYVTAPRSPLPPHGRWERERRTRLLLRREIPSRTFLLRRETREEKDGEKFAVCCCLSTIYSNSACVGLKSRNIGSRRIDRLEFHRKKWNTAKKKKHYVIRRSVSRCLRGNIRD